MPTRLAIWNRRAPGPLEVSVNLSLVNLEDYEILDDVSAALEASEIDPAALVLEITESTVMREHDVGREILHELKKLGVRLALDDFGTGYSSLSRLSELPFDSLKIPRPFIERITHDDQDFALTQGIVDLGHHLDLTIVAEGIETRQPARQRARDRLRARPGLPARQARARGADRSSAGSDHRTVDRAPERPRRARPTRCTLVA